MQRNATHLTQLEQLHTNVLFHAYQLTMEPITRSSKIVTIRSFKKWLKRHFSTAKPPLYYSYGTKSISTLRARLRTDTSQLNSHMFLTEKTTTPVYPCGHPQENSIHFKFACPRCTQIGNAVPRHVSTFIT